jgi:hypothetical protein
MDKKKKDNKKGEEVSEIFEVEKDGKEKIVETHGIEEEKPVTKDQINKEKKIFLIIILTMVGFALLFIATYVIINLSNQIEVEGVKFLMDKTTMSGKTLYKTSLPVTYNQSKATYNFYLRGNPKQTIKIPFEGNLLMLGNMVLNQTENFNCDGDGIIGIANVLNLYNVLGVKVIADKNATCDSIGRYMFLNIKSGNETKIEQTGISCYEIQVKDCEILPATERFMLETLIETHKYVK